MISWGETSLQYSIELMHTPVPQVMGPDVDPSSSLRSLQGGLSDNEEEEEEEEEKDKEEEDKEEEAEKEAEKEAEEEYLPCLPP
jgi:hypothetical protein